jgi:periplasmic divalent cation tolerance protein
MSEFISVYITVPTQEMADKIARTLVEEQLAACVSITPGVRSIYRWQGKVETSDEIALVAKTRASLFALLEKRVKELHSYECPCIVAWPIKQGHRPYLEWIEAETETKTGS